MSTLQFWLTFNNGAERLQLPVNPEMISVATSRGYEDIEVTQLGEYTVIGNARLKEFTFSSFFPRDYNSSYCEYANIPNPWEAVALIERWSASGSPIRFTVTSDDSRTLINEAVTIRSFPYEERAGSVGDLYFDMTLKQYIFIEFKRIRDMQTQVSGLSVDITEELLRSDTRETPTSYTVKSGDSLWKIAQRVFGSGDRWREIYDANASTIGPNPNMISVGQTLVIPS